MSDMISVITVTYNAVNSLEKTILSVIGQSYSFVEFIVIDGESTDGTKNLIEKHKDKIAYYKSEKDNGIYDAMNKGVKASTGDWIIFLGADDIFYTDSVIEEIFNKDQSNIDFIYGNVILKSKSKVFGGERNYYQLIDRNINHQSIFYNRRIFAEIGGFDTKYRILADYDLNLRIFRNPTFAKSYIPKIICLFDDRGISSSTIDDNFCIDQLDHFTRLENMSPDNPLLQKYYFYHGFACTFNGKWRIGLKNIFKSIVKGKRKFYYILLAGKFYLSIVGIGKKINVI